MTRILKLAMHAVDIPIRADFSSFHNLSPFEMLFLRHDELHLVSTGDRLLICWHSFWQTARTIALWCHAIVYITLIGKMVFGSDNRAKPFIRLNSKREKHTHSH